MDLDVSIIIVNYKTSSLVADCLRSIIALTKDINYEVIIIDNNSEINFKEIILSKARMSSEANIHFITLEENLGFGKANNEGLRIAQGRNIFFLNPDTVLMNNAVKILSDFLDSKADAGACGGNLYDGDSKPAYSFKRMFPGFFWEFNELLNFYPQKIAYGKNYSFNNSGKILKVAYITGADLMVKREAIDKTGGFRKEIFLYFEETDLCKRITDAGYTIYSVPEAKIQHLESKSFEETSQWQSEFKTENLEVSRNIYYKFNVNYLQRKLSQNLYHLFLVSRICLLKKGNKKEYYKIRRKYFKQGLNDVV